MRDPKRIEILLDKLGVLWRLNPDLRFGQLVANLGARGTDLFYQEDDATLAEIEFYLVEASLAHH